MLSWVALFAAIALSLSVVYVGYRERRALRTLTARLVRGIESRTEEQPPGSEEVTDSELDDLLNDAVQQEDPAVALCAVHELESKARLHKLRIQGFARLAGRVPFLACLAAIIVILALSGLDRQALYLAGAAAFVGLVGSLIAQLFSRSALGSARKFSDLCRELAAQVEKHWSAEQPGKSAARQREAGE